VPDQPLRLIHKTKNMKLYDWHQSQTHIYINPHVPLTITQSTISTPSHTSILYKNVTSVTLSNGVYVLQKDMKEMWPCLTVETREEVCEEHVEDEKDDSLDGLLIKLYKDGDDEKRRAMDKSFRESGGTMLSTDWERVKGKKQK
ncbi:Suppressor of G2 allele of skp1, partial [Trachipleistophora hominis]